MKMHKNEAIPIATCIFHGGSWAFSHVSSLQLFLPNQMKYGTFKPVCKNVPAEARVSKKPAQRICSWNPAATIIDLLTNPENRGKAEIDKPPIIVKINVLGIFL